MNDAELWRRFRDGDDVAFSMLYQTQIDLLYRYGHKLSADTELVEDSIQDMFIELWNSRQRLSDTDSIKFYLFRILRRKITRNPLNRMTAGVTGDYADQLLFSISAESELIDLENEHSRMLMINRVLSKLPPRQQEVINLRYFNNFSHQQIGDMMNISLQSVHNILQKSMKNLRAMLSGYTEIILSASAVLFSWLSAPFLHNI